MNATEPSENLSTDFLPSVRSTEEQIKGDATQFNGESFFETVADSMPNVVAILDHNRQIVFANKAILNMMHIDDPHKVLGLRWGEAIYCKHACENAGGCGTSKACRYCGAANAIIKSQAGISAVEECRIRATDEGTESAIDLRVWTTPIVHHGEHFICFTAIDIIDEKQRYFLERIFLHDIMNTASALRGFSELISDGDVDEDMGKEFMQRILFLSGRIIEEINGHRQLLAAEKGELDLALKALNSRLFLKGIYDAYNRPDILNGRHLQMDEAIPDVTFTSDETLLNRVVGNMVKNAIEASVPGETVIAGCSATDEQIVFQVQNPTYMPENIRLQVFNRSFSTKGAGRGLGTYSMKFLTEKYLQGSISFISTEKDGTTFTVTYPRQL